MVATRPCRHERLTPFPADAIAGGIWRRVNRLVREGKGAKVPEFMYFVFVPCLGIDAVQGEAPPSSLLNGPQLGGIVSPWLRRETKVLETTSLPSSSPCTAVATTFHLTLLPSTSASASSPPLPQTVAEHGYNKTTVALITDAASVSRRTFYEHFSGKEDCFLAAFDALSTHLFGLMAEAVAGQSEWSDQVAAALIAPLRFFASHPELARVYMVEAVSAGEIMADRREERARRLTAFLEAGRSQRIGNRDLADGLEEAIAGGIITLLFSRVRAGEAEQLERFAPAMIEFALSPYLGIEEARKLAARHTSDRSS